ncbi:hypothetical protein HYC85_016785 [Camellia sinensis]|uniref:Uncharacterized protein n=1 Tax=Camellia sinensis TaxID=4442 RepID=A0A7J7H1T2_CAMSI|nr:hypothetical protein HYC85_016785 [Camellia sinensis]
MQSALSTWIGQISGKTHGRGPNILMLIHKNSRCIIVQNSSSQKSTQNLLG